MLRSICLIVVLSSCLILASAQIPTNLGWYQIPNSQLSTVCPSGTLPGCLNVVGAWNSGLVDTTRNRMVIWGGGHGDYSGNEIYVLNLSSSPVVERITNPTAGGCSQASCDGGATPNSRHTYDGIEYMPNVDRMFVYSGALAGNGYSQQDTWTFSFATKTWQLMNPSGQLPLGTVGVRTAYDPNTQKVFVHDNDSLYAYTFSSNSFARWGGEHDARDYHLTSVVDPVRKLFVSVGGGQASIFNIGAGPAESQPLNTTGGDAIVSAGYPGLVYDPLSDRIVGWNGGDTVYSLNMDTKVWTATTYSGGPGAPTSTGTFNRWNYSPASGVFVLVNKMDQNGFTLRLTNGTPPIPDTQVPTVPTNLTAMPVSSSQVNLTWTASTDNIGVSGYRVERCPGMNCTNFAQVGSPTGANYSDNGLAASTSYSYRVRATDAAGNLSPYSSIVSATTQGASSTWTFCANENQQCSFSGSKEVQYGANDFFAYKVLSGGTSCSNAVFGDPLPSSGKACSVRDVTGSLPASWMWCANEGGACSFSGSKNVRYGANGTYNVLTLSNGTACTNAVFGDPISGTSKSCAINDAITISPPPGATTLTVGPGKQYATISAAIAVASPGSTIEIDAGLYPDESFTATNLTLRGIGGRFHIRWGTGDYRTNTAGIPNGKGLIVIQNGGTIENGEFSGAKVADENGAGIRYESGSLTVRGSYFHDNQNGMLGNGGSADTLLIENSIFSKNGYCGQFCAHNLYIGNMGRLIFRYNKTVDSEDGHTLKSRASINEILYNFISTKNSSGSYEVDLSNGGTAYLIGNVIEQGANSGNASIVAYGAEGVTNPNPALYVVNNTFANYRSAGATFIQVSGTPAITVKNNAYLGSGTLLSGATTDLSSNKLLTATDFMNGNAGDYHLVSTSTAINAGVAPGSAGTYDLAPMFEYVEPASKIARALSGVIDVGAYESNVTVPTDPCVAAPLILSVTQWPTSTTSGSKTFRYTTNQPRTGFNMNLDGTQVVFKDGRGCTVTINK